jgi:N-(2-amino-2-carboxyethyl)-L-glutamate synthase
MNEGVLSSIGNTPMVRLARFFPDVSFKLYAKMEMLNPGGSTKDRPALNIIQQGISSGKIRPETVIVESSSGNMGIGLAQICSHSGLRFICVVDPKTTQQNMDILRAYGAEIVRVTEPDPVTKEFLQARINRVKELLDSIPYSFWPNQYANENNSISHKQTMREIANALDGKVDYLFCATSTCGTLRGCAEYTRDHHLNTKIIAVDAVGSVIFGGSRAKRLIPGHGAAVPPELFQPDLAERCIHVTDLDCVVGCRRLIRREAILAGGSSGAVMMAVSKLKHEIPRDANCAVLFPDRGERYLDTIYSDAWVKAHLGDVAHYWEEVVESAAYV